MSNRDDVKEQEQPVHLFRVTDYGAKPDSGEDSSRAIQAAIAAASTADGLAVIELPNGRYDLYPDEAAKAAYYVSNTASEAEHPDPVKTIGLLFKGMSRFRVEGNDSLLMFHGKMTPIVLDGCEDAEIRNLQIDFVRPTISEMRISAVGERHWDVDVHPDSRFRLSDGKLDWIGDGWSHRGGPAQEYDPVSNRTWRVPNPVKMAKQVERLAPGKLRLKFASAPRTEVGRVFQMRDGIRDQVGSLIVGCRNVVWRNVWMRYMHGLGIVGQFSENLTLQGLRLAPHPAGGRTAAAFADFVHMSGIRGRLTIADSLFEGAHDDAINVHGTHLRIVGQADGRRIRVAFMHHQSYGFQAFHPGDEIDFISASKLTPYATRTVTNVKPVSLREVELTLDAPAPTSIEDGDVVENATWTPEVCISGNSFKRIPTRGVLLTTRRKATIENNLFERLHMSAVLIADDAGSWFESGMVRDVRITGNRFVECGGDSDPVIFIHPENTDVSAEHPVHSGIFVDGNSFELDGARLLEAKSTRNIVVSENRISYAGTIRDTVTSDREVELIRLLACSEVSISGNRFDGGTVTPTVTAIAMENVQLTSDLGRTIRIKGEWE